MRNYCTLFDKKYLSRGLALYASLRANSRDFHLYIYCFDDDVYRFLQTHALESVTPIALAEFEDQQLLSIKSTRTVGEYCWTCTPCIILHSLVTFNLTECTYLDADLYFFADPELLHAEMPADKSVLVTEHRYSAEYDQTHTSGKYCVQFITFKHSNAGLNILLWWKEKCLAWCFARFEEGKFGDQKYLDDWLLRFPGEIHELQHLGTVAPWNVQQYAFFKEKDAAQIFLTEKTTGNVYPVVFYHFHNLKFGDNKGYYHPPFFYKISNQAYQFLYQPYLQAFLAQAQQFADLHQLTEFPAIPTEISQEQFENVIIPNANHHYLLITQAYVLDKSRLVYCYQLSQRYPEVLVGLMHAGYNLSRESDLVSSHTDLTTINKNLNRQLQDVCAQLNLQKAQSYLWPEVKTGVAWDKITKSGLNDITKDEFEIRFAFEFDAKELINVAWQPMVNTYCKVKLISMQCVSATGHIQELDLHDIKHNGIELEDGFIEFIRLNGVISLPKPKPQSVQLILRGQWERFEHWQLGERVHAMLHKKRFGRLGWLLG